MRGDRAAVSWSTNPEFNWFLNIRLSPLKNLTAEELVSFDDVSLVTSLLLQAVLLFLLRHHNLHPISIPSGLFG